MRACTLTSHTLRARRFEAHDEAWVSRVGHCLRPLVEAATEVLTQREVGSERLAVEMGDHAGDELDGVSAPSGAAGRSIRSMLSPAIVCTTALSNESVVGRGVPPATVTVPGIAAARASTRSGSGNAGTHRVTARGGRPRRGTGTCSVGRIEPCAPGGRLRGDRPSQQAGTEPVGGGGGTGAHQHEASRGVLQRDRQRVGMDALGQVDARCNCQPCGGPSAPLDAHELVVGLGRRVRPAARTT
jgi:hypothetical protein